MTKLNFNLLCASVAIGVLAGSVDGYAAEIPIPTAEVANTIAHNTVQQTPISEQNNEPGARESGISLSLPKYSGRIRNYWVKIPEGLAPKNFYGYLLIGLNDTMIFPENLPQGRGPLNLADVPLGFLPPKAIVTRKSPHKAHLQVDYEGSEETLKAIADKLGITKQPGMTTTQEIRGAIFYCTLILGSEQPNPPAPQWQVEGNVFSDEHLPAEEAPKH